MRICLDVTWLPLVFPAESSDSVLVLFLSLCEIHPLLMLDMGRTELGVAFGDFILADTTC